MSMSVECCCNIYAPPDPATDCTRLATQEDGLCDDYRERHPQRSGVRASESGLEPNGAALRAAASGSPLASSQAAARELLGRFDDDYPVFRAWMRSVSDG